MVGGALAVAVWAFGSSRSSVAEALRGDASPRWWLAIGALVVLTIVLGRLLTAPLD